MAFAFADLLAFNNVESTDIGAAPAIIQNTYTDGWLIPEVTFTKKFERGNASIVYCRKPGKATVTTVQATAAGALDFVHAETADSIVIINVSTVLKASEKCYEAVEVSRESGKLLEKYEIVVKSLQEKLNAQAEGVLRAGATVVATAQSTATTIYTNITNMLATYRANSGTANPVLVCSSATIALILQNAAKVGFTPATGDEAYVNGRVGRIAGMQVIENNNIDVANSELEANDKAIEFYLYHPDDFALIASLDVMRAQNSENFVGFYAQGMVIFGAAVLRGTQVYAKGYVVA